MSKKNWLQFNWRNTLTVLIIATGAMVSEFPARANVTSESWQLAQATISDYGNSPTPLNLRPRVHIPLPSRSRNRYYPRYRRSNRRHHDYSDHYYRRHYRRHDYGYRKPRGNRGKVIIINSGHLNDYGSIRVIRKYSD